MDERFRAAVPKDTTAGHAFYGICLHILETAVLQNGSPLFLINKDLEKAGHSPNFSGHVALKIVEV